ncbi:winged helix-turn-helix transcriptional regulator [Chryseolinea lacunae]|uniref:Helix-turn-helix transcriptional regulator n=1 Tax=Chryseolinea lacunae TaxID=2801331 RepID=A0ABS1KWH1_9BACT|nr:helix-turn-helix domain-containing protein [Chryseolinea lacunae]MBL0743719.1 helix-turn-helix transcriptional regulator [Chryseolinea lacunae]
MTVTQEVTFGESLDHTECTKSLMAIRDALDVLNGKWKLQIIIAISSGQHKFKDIERQIPKITPRMLSKELKSLEENQLLKRIVYDTLPVTIEYKLTPHAKTLEKVIAELRNWGALHRKKILGR